MPAYNSSRLKKGFQNPNPERIFGDRGLPEVTWIGDGDSRLFSNLEYFFFKAWLWQALPDFYRTKLIIAILEDTELIMNQNKQILNQKLPL